MSHIIPFISSQEPAKIKEELCGKDISVIFNGTMRMGEAMGIWVHNPVSVHFHAILILHFYLLSH